MTSFFKSLLLVAVCVTFAAVTVRAGDHGCCANSAAVSKSKDAKSASECAGHNEAECPHMKGAHAKTASKYGNCPVSGEPATKAVTLTFEGTTYHFCCKDCIKDFKANPAKYSVKSKS